MHIFIKSSWLSHNAKHHISPSLSVYTSSGPSVWPWSSDSIRWSAAGLIWLSGSWTALILDKSTQSLVLITTILGKKLKPIQEHGSRCCRVNSRQARLRLASFPVCEQEPFGRSSRCLSDSLSAFINLAEIMCFSLSRLSLCLSASPCPSFHQSVWISPNALSIITFLDYSN